MRPVTTLLSRSSHALNLPKFFIFIFSTWLILSGRFDTVVNAAELEHCVQDDNNCNAAVETVGPIDYRLNNLNYDDPELIELLKSDYLIPPSIEEYNFSTTDVGLNGKLLYRKYIIFC